MITATIKAVDDSGNGAELTVRGVLKICTYPDKDEKFTLIINDAKITKHLIVGEPKMECGGCGDIST